MSRSYQIKLSPEALAILRHMGDAPKLMKAMAEAMDYENEATKRKIVKERLTGTGPFPVSMHRLGVRSNKLRDSLRVTDATVHGSRILGMIGTNIEYAGVHEFGFKDTVSIPAHTRSRVKVETVVRIGKDGRQRKSKRQVRVADIGVKAHKRDMNIPARAPITTGVEERLDALGNAMSVAIVEAMGRIGQ